MDFEEWLALFVGAIVLILVSTFFTIGVIKYEQKWGTDSGYVIDKSYSSAYSSTEYKDNKVITHNHAEQYKLKLQKEVENELMNKWIEVDKDTYHNYKVGDYYDLREN